MNNQGSNNWEYCQLEDVVTKSSSNISLNKIKNDKGAYPLFAAQGFVQNISSYHQKQEYLAIIKDGAGIGRVSKHPAKSSVVATMQYLIPKKSFDIDFIKYFLEGIDFKKYRNGSTIPHIYFKDYKSEKFPKLHITEQQRIVSILDKCFTAIDKAKANAEQNLKNTKELFESYLQKVFDKGNEDWDKKKLRDAIDYDKNQNLHIGLPYIGLEHIQSNSGKFLGSLEPKEVKSFTFYFNEQHILYGRLRPYLNKVLLPDFEGHCSTEIFPIKTKKEITREFLFYWLISRATVEKINATWTGTRMPRANMNQVLEFDFSFPSLKIQQIIVRQLNVLRAKTQKLEAIYQNKIYDLEELKKSILQMVFAGELTLSASTSVSVAKAIPLQKIDGISSTDLQAGITAIALQKHIALNQQNTFGHVKAEKIVHLAEYILNINLERKPVKDAAGPNDFQHAKKVEKRAKMAGFYTVTKRMTNDEISYIYAQGRSIVILINKTKKYLGEKNNVLSQLLDKTAKMTTQQAEIVATVYAAWNNLILNGNQFTDEDIVSEARENWHLKKMEIPRWKFFKAIEWMRKNELFIPKGNGKMVLAK